MNRYSSVVSTAGESALETNKVLRNTYLLLGATLGFSAITATLAVIFNMPPMGNHPWVRIPPLPPSRIAGSHGYLSSRTDLS